MKLAGVWVNEKYPPSRKQLIKMALNSLKYHNKRNALELIEKEIDESGLFKRNIEKPTKRGKGPGSKSRKSPNGEKKADINKGSESDA